MKTPLLIDGSYGEGGGQILRTALVFSLLTETPFRMINIRKGRKKPGLKPQHLHILKALEKLTRCDVKGMKEGSLEITLHPGKIIGGALEIDFHTAGSITLFLQTVLPVSFFARKPVNLRIRGGTDVPMSMTWDYFEKVFIPLISRYAQQVKTRLIRRGYYPKGGGEVEISVIPFFKGKEGEISKDFLLRLRNAKRKLILNEDTEITEILLYSIASVHLQNRKVAERQVKGATEYLQRRLRVKIKSFTKYQDALSPGSSFLAIAQRKNSTLGSDNIGKLGTRAEDVGKEAARNLIEDIETGASVDTHMADNLIPWLALFGGKISFPKKTAHLETNIWITERFLGSIFKIGKRAQMFTLSA